MGLLKLLQLLAVGFSLCFTGLYFHLMLYPILNGGVAVIYINMTVHGEYIIEAVLLPIIFTFIIVFLLSLIYQLTQRNKGGESD